MKTQNVNARLAFNKSSVLELNDAELLEVDGGTSPVCFYVGYAILASSGSCAATAIAVVGGAVGYTIATNQN